MCGIVGVIGVDSDMYIREMNASQVHRGPDDEGYFFDSKQKVHLAMRRLSIVDIETGHQPMTNETGEIIIVYNGEIFNATELRQCLRDKGHKFKTNNSDTEVLVHLYEEYREKMVQKLNGMFAFIIYDKGKRQIFAARDHMGIKPLYYACVDGKLLIASELKSILSLKLINPSIDMQSLFHFLSVQCIVSPRTIYQEVKKLPAAHFLIYDISEKKLITKEYWNLEFAPPIKDSRGDIILQLRDRLLTAVNRWSMSDVPISCMLSGGIDSTAILALLNMAGINCIDTFTLGFTDADNLDERKLARLVADKYGCKHHEIVLNASDLIDDLEQMVYAVDEPYAGGIPSWYVYKNIHKYSKVAFSGIGGDELFGNYGKWKRYTNLFEAISKTKERLDKKEAVWELISCWPGNVYHKFWSENMKMKVLEESSIENVEKTSELYRRLLNRCPDKNWRNKIAYVDFKIQLPDEFLHVTDRYAMAHSVEARVPFLDKELVEWVMRIPPELRSDSKKLKILLIDSISDLLPKEILEAPKRGFVIPYEKWLRGELREQLYDYFSVDYLKKQGIFNEQIQDILLKPFFEGNSKFTMLIWTVFTFQLWYKQYME